MTPFGHLSCKGTMFSSFSNTLVYTNHLKITLFNIQKYFLPNISLQQKSLKIILWDYIFRPKDVFTYFFSVENHSKKDRNIIVLKCLLYLFLNKRL